MNQSMIGILKTIVFDAIENEETLDGIIKTISNKMGNAFTGKWQCFAYSHFGNFFVYKKAKNYIWFSLGDLSIVLFQSGSN